MLSPDLATRMAALNSRAMLPEVPLLSTNLTGVDTHGHVFTRALPMAEGRRYTPAYDAPISAYLAMLDANDISHGVLVQPSFLGTNNAYLLKALRLAPKRLRGVVVLSPQTDAGELAVLDGIGVVGVRLNLIETPDPAFTSATMQRHMRDLADLGWLIELQAEASRLPQIMPALLDASVKVLVDHFGRPSPALGVDCPGFRYLLSLGETRQVWVKLSGAYRNGTVNPVEHVAVPATRLLLQSFGAGRLVWGSDWPHTGYEQSGSPDAARRALDQWVPAPANRAAVLSGTPCALFGFEALDEKNQQADAPQSAIRLGAGDGDGDA